jgi:hypothetical protein
MSTIPMSRTQARALEWTIIAICLVALFCVFQPFSLTLYGIGAALVVLGGLSFNLIPQCVPGRPIGAVGRVALIVVITFFVVAALAVGSAYLYVWYLAAK